MKFVAATCCCYMLQRFVAPCVPALKNIAHFSSRVIIVTEALLEEEKFQEIIFRLMVKTGLVDTKYNSLINLCYHDIKE